MEQVNMSNKGKGAKTNPMKAVRDIARLSARLRELEDEVRECRQQQHRLAELTDVVTELLVPLSRRDQDKVDAILARYSEQLG
jgi:hypothetical protein